MTKTLHPLLSQCSSTKWGKGEGALIRGWKGAHLKGALIWSGGGANLRIYGGPSLSNTMSQQYWHMLDQRRLQAGKECKLAHSTQKSEKQKFLEFASRPKLDK